MKNTMMLLTFIVGFMPSTFSQNEPTQQSMEKVPPLVQPKNRIGFVLGGGVGFTNVPVLELTDGTKVNISFGGGTAVKIEYGYEFNRHFDLALNLGGQFGQLDQTVDNATMAFNRSVFSVTPSYIILFPGKGNMCLKIGAGIDVIYNAQLNYDFSKVPGGYKDDWKYNGTIGEHLSITYEVWLPKRFSLTAGINLCNASYTFKSGGTTYPTEEDLKTPKGSGVDFLVGVHYHFNWRKG